MCIKNDEVPLKLILVDTVKTFEALKFLMMEYANELGVDLCFQKFDEELSNLSGNYGPPNGVAGILKDGKDKFVGCVGVRRNDEVSAELKRMYIKKEYRGKGYGEMLLEFSIDKAKELGYKKLRLDTLSSLVPAINLYKNYGFKEIKPYRYNPYENVVYMELRLNQ